MNIKKKDKNIYLIVFPSIRILKKYMNKVGKALH